jgi:hypothetical protein
MMARDPAQCAARCSIAASADTLRPGQGVGLSVAREIVEQYDGRILAEESLLGGACMEVIFGRQPWKIKRVNSRFLTAPASCRYRIRYNPCQTPAVEYKYGLSINA